MEKKGREGFGVRGGKGNEEETGGREGRKEEDQGKGGLVD